MNDRSRRPEIDATTLVVAALALLTVLAALLVNATAGSVRLSGPDEVPLDRATVICPPGGDEVVVASLSGATGAIPVRTGGIEREVAVAPGVAGTLKVGDKSAVVTGRDELAPGLVAGRFGRPLMSIDCRAPVFDQWFTGLGAGAKHRSVLQLANPDTGRAIVDVTVLGRNGPVDVPELRGVAIRGGESREFDLATIVPRADDLALRARTVRGRISASVLDTFEELGADQMGTDGLASQEEPARTNLLLGIPGGPGQRTLVLANPGDSAGRASIELVTGDAIFTPDNAPMIALPPQSVVRVPLASVLKGAGAREDERPLGIQVESSVPTTTGLVMFVEGDLTHAVPVPPLVATGTTPLPAGTKRVVLGGAIGPGVVTMAFIDSAGKALPEKRVQVTSGQALEVRLPTRARVMTVTPSRTPISAVVVVTGNGATLVRVREPVMTGLVPQVAPGSP